MFFVSVNLKIVQKDFKGIKRRTFFYEFKEFNFTGLCFKLLSIGAFKKSDMSNCYEIQHLLNYFFHVY